MSPALLSKRLRELEAAGVIRRVEVRASGGILEYQLTSAGKEAEKVVESIGFWGQSCVETHESLKNLDPSLLMWDMRRNLDPTPMPKRRCVLLFAYPELPAARRNWWLVIELRSEVDLCSVDPGFEVDLYVTIDLRTMTAIWMGITTVREAANSGKLSLVGDQLLAAQMQTWLRLSPFAKGKSRLSA